MSVETTARKQNFAGGQSALTFTFKTLPDHPEDIKVVVVSSGTETALTYTTQYTVALATDGVGGVVTVSPSYSTAYTYTVYRETTKKQESDYDDYNQFPADTLENDLDRRTLIEQELSEAIDRSLLLPVSSTLSSLSLPNPVAGRALKWNAGADGLENTSADIDTYLTAASNYATTASTQAAAAAVSATTANAAAVLAGLYATTAGTAVADVALAGLYAQTASTAATAAATSATLAGNYATTTATASLYAQTASTQAALAGNYATTASTAATNASNSASSASTSAISAATSATLAGLYAQTASTNAIPALSGNDGKVLTVSSGGLTTYWAVATTGGGGGATGVRGVFTVANATTGTLTISYSTVVTTPGVLHVAICNSNGVLIIPDSITFSVSSAAVSITSFHPIAGTWGYYYI